MSYTLHGHFFGRTSGAFGIADRSPIWRFALIDAGQLPRRAANHLLAHLGSGMQALFEGTFAEPAIALSPWLIELDAMPERCADQIHRIDQCCSALPIFSLIDSIMPLDTLTVHLQSHLRIQADGAEYLLRLADTQMLGAFADVLSQGQLRSLLEGIRSWWFTGHGCEVIDLADLLHTSDIPGESAQTLSAAQTQALLHAAELPITASQLKNYDPSFGTMSHIEQMRFLDACRATLNPEDSETDLLARALSRWQQRSSDQEHGHA